MLSLKMIVVKTEYHQMGCILKCYGDCESIFEQLKHLIITCALSPSPVPWNSRVPWASVGSDVVWYMACHFVSDCFLQQNNIFIIHCIPFPSIIVTFAVITVPERTFSHTAVWSSVAGSFLMLVGNLWLWPWGHWRWTAMSVCIYKRCRNIIGIRLLFFSVRVIVWVEVMTRK